MGEAQDKLVQLTGQPFERHLRSGKVVQVRGLPGHGGSADDEARRKGISDFAGSQWRAELQSHKSSFPFADPDEVRNIRTEHADDEDPKDVVPKGYKAPISLRERRKLEYGDKSTADVQTMRAKAHAAALAAETDDDRKAHEALVSKHDTELKRRKAGDFPDGTTGDSGGTSKDLDETVARIKAARAKKAVGQEKPHSGRIGPSNEDIVKNAETMYGTGSKQHLEAKRRFGKKAGK